jgi:integrase
MSDHQSTAHVPSAKPAKPQKPSPDFPLTAHPAGYWCKKIHGRIHYFGPWSDPEGALKKYLEQKDDLHAGRVPREGRPTEEGTVKAVCNAFLNARKALLDNGELSPRTWTEYRNITDLLVQRFGKHRPVDDLTPADFGDLREYMASRWGPYRLSNAVQFTRTIFRFAYESGLIATPARFGPGFKRPTAKTIRLHKAARGAKLFTADEVRQMIGAAGPQMRAMILLGINCGLGNNDCGRVPQGAIDLDGGWITYPRPKTGINRRCSLWPETVAAIREALAARPAPKEPADAGLVFLTSHGLPWARDNTPSTVSNEFTRLLRALGINGRKGLGFYTLRHTFRTVADEAKDQPAADYIMGHDVPHMSSVYRETISDARLRAVADHVRAWLFPPESAVDAMPMTPQE